MAQSALGRAAELLASGTAPVGANKGFYMEQTVLGRVSDDAKIMTEEPFEPVAPINTLTDSFDVMIRTNVLPFGLTGHVFSNNLSLARRAYEDLGVGTVGVNEILLATAKARFNGVKEGGMGGVQNTILP